MPAKRQTQQSARPDEDLARDIRHALRFDNDVPDERITLQVERGTVTLRGTVEAIVQKETAEADARRVRGVLGVINKIDVEPATAGTAAH
ncbi:MAG TPA: BON domain-containing protein [Bryobacteraceae bacterium]|nr:BON domain-containing protein [Bryobacteraceae bacterium]